MAYLLVISESFEGNTILPAKLEVVKFHYYPLSPQSWVRVELGKDRFLVTCMM
jgi:hypothetical protein